MSLLALALPLATLADAWREPPHPFHPVVWNGWATSRAKAWLLRGLPWVQLIKGACWSLCIPSLLACAAWLSLAASAVYHPALELVVAVFWLKSSFALRGLIAAAGRVIERVAVRDIESARQELTALCSRDSKSLGSGELLEAALESASENLNDSVVAPLLYACVFGVPGAVFFRAVNTLDSMLGYRGELEWAGKAAARLDDCLGWIPARLSALLLLGCGAFSGLDARQGWRVARADARATSSPNAGWPMAASAGLLGVELSKPAADGGDEYRLGAGPGARELSAGLAWRGLRLVRQAGLVTVLAASGFWLCRVWCGW